MEYIKQIKEEIKRSEELRDSIKAEYAGVQAFLDGARYLPRNLKHSVTEAYESRINQLSQDIIDMKENLKCQEASACGITA